MKPKLQKVCQFYLEGCSMAEALFKGGYSEGYARHNASKFLKNREVIRYIREQQKIQQEYENYKHRDFFKFLKSKLEDPSIDEKSRVEYTKILQRLGGFDKEYEILEKELDSKKNSTIATSGELTIHITPAIKPDEQK